MLSDSELEDGYLVGLDRKAWSERLVTYTERRGIWLTLSQTHMAGLIRGDRTLVVTFESVEEVRSGRKTAAPIGYDMSERFDWSVLTILADGATWFRDPVLYAFFDELTDSDFWDDYDNILFYGAGMGGYGAAAFSVAAPGARALVISPVATLDPQIAGWDTRYTSHRRKDFNSRYGFAPEMTDALSNAYVVYDPEVEISAMHASLFTRPQVTKLRARHFGPNVEATLEDIEVLADMLGLAGMGLLNPRTFSRLMRRRRNHPPYLRKLFRHLQDEGRTKLLGWLSANVAERRNLPRFRKMAEELREQGVLSSEPTSSTAAE